MPPFGPRMLQQCPPHPQLRPRAKLAQWSGPQPGPLCCGQVGREAGGPTHAVRMPPAPQEQGGLQAQVNAARPTEALLDLRGLGVKAEAPGPTAAPSSGSSPGLHPYPGLAPGKFLTGLSLSHLLDTCVPHMLGGGRRQPLGVLSLSSHPCWEGVALEGSSWSAVNKRKPPSFLGTWQAAMAPSGCRQGSQPAPLV